MSTKSRENIINKIKRSLAKIRPYLVADGGNVVFVGLTNEFEVIVKLTGACRHCPFSGYTFKYGVELTLLKEIPILKSVMAV